MKSPLLCRNGDCTRKPTHGRGRWCLRCWAGMKWTSIRQRVENKNGNNPSYKGRPLLFTRESLIAWVMENPPPHEMAEPSIDKIVDHLGYAPGNIRWLEKRANSRLHRKDVPLDKQVCPLCNETKPRTAQFFVANKAKLSGVGTYCRPCNLKYQKAWRKKEVA